MKGECDAVLDFAKDPAHFFYGLHLFERAGQDLRCGAHHIKCRLARDVSGAPGLVAGAAGGFSALPQPLPLLPNRFERLAVAVANHTPLFCQLPSPLCLVPASFRRQGALLRRRIVGHGIWKVTRAVRLDRSGSPAVLAIDGIRGVRHDS